MLCTATSQRLTDFRGDIGIIMVTEQPDLDTMDPTTAAHLRRLMSLGDFKGEAKTSSFIYTNDEKIPRLLFVGAGKEDLDTERIRQIFAQSAKTVSEIGLTSAVIPVHASATPEEIEAAATAIPLSLYQFHHKTKISEADEKRLKLKSVTFLTEDAERKAMVETAVQRGSIYANGTILARHLSNEPGNYMTPTKLAETAETIAAEYGLNCQIFNKMMLERKHFGGLLAVAQGSLEEPTFTILEYLPDDAYNETIVLVGKGITYDTGGVNVKAADGLLGMKADMSGAAAVIGAMQSIAQLKPKNVRVIGLIASAENHIGPAALKPDDVITMYNGKKVEIVNTDAEGRLVLGDALHWAAQYAPNAVIDLATLTGAVLVTFGHYVAGAMTNNPSLLSKVETAALQTHERISELPLLDDYDEDVSSKIADIKNLGEARNAGTIAAAKFLQFFVDDNYPWVHLDIAGTAWGVKGSNYIPPEGASGWGSRLLTKFVENWTHTDR